MNVRLTNSECRQLRQWPKQRRDNNGYVRATAVSLLDKGRAAGCIAHDSGLDHALAYQLYGRSCPGISPPPYTHCRAGHPAEQLRVSLNTIGYMVETTPQVIEVFYPAHNTLGRKAGWPAAMPARFAQLAAPGAALVGDSPADVVAKFWHIDEVLGAWRALACK